VTSDAAVPPGADSDDPTVAQASEVIEIGNEFAAVRVRKVLTRNGERLEIDARRLGHRIRLDALELESLTWQSHDLFSKLLESPFGG
jgi:hypothetical protein